MKKGKSNSKPSAGKEDRLIEWLFWLCVSMIVLIPLVFSTAVYRAYLAPKYALLVVGSALILLILALIVRRDRLGIIRTYDLKSRHFALVCLYLCIVSLSTLLGTAPVASFFGSSYNQMGLLTRLCFFIFFVGLIIALGTNQRRFRHVLWAIALTGLIVATYAYVQFFGRDPFTSPSLYGFGSDAEPVVRVHSTLGHSNFLGNFLLYTTLLTAGLSLAATGRARRIAIAATLLSVAAIVFSGTRGSWIGLIAGVVAFITMWSLDRVKPGLRLFNRRLVWRGLIGIALVGFLVWAISINPVSRSIKLRAQSFAAEGFTGSGRTLLWRDALRMVPQFALKGCGPEAFRKEFLAYKSKELARLAPGTNNESSHNSYLDAAISFGLLGLALYVAVITSTLSLIFRARRRCASIEMKKILTGLGAAMIAVLIHNFFIFDQISTGFYFFAFVAFAFTADRIVRSETEQASTPKAEESTVPSGVVGWIGNAAVVVTGVILALALWHCLAMLGADRSTVNAFAAANAGDVDQVIKLSTETSHAADPSSNYDLLFAQALTLCAERIQSSLDATGMQEGERNHLAGMRSRAIEMAITFADRSVRHTLTPDSSHLLLAYLGLLSGNKQLLSDHASAAVRLDPNFSNARWLMAEAYMADGDHRKAKQEALLAMDLNPYSTEARQSLIRSQGRTGRNPTTGSESMISYARAEIASENPRKAENILRRAIRLSKDQCPECHLLLASIYEAENNYERAIAELETYQKQASTDSTFEDVTQRIEMLRGRLIEKK